MNTWNTQELGPNRWLLTQFDEEEYNQTLQAAAYLQDDITPEELEEGARDEATWHYLVIEDEKGRKMVIDADSDGTPWELFGIYHPPYWMTIEETIKLVEINPDHDFCSNCGEEVLTSQIPEFLFDQISSYGGGLSYIGMDDMYHDPDYCDQCWEEHYGDDDLGV